MSVKDNFTLPLCANVGLLIVFSVDMFRKVVESVWRPSLSTT